MMTSRSTGFGYAMAILNALVSGVAIYLNTMLVQAPSVSPSTYTAVKNGLVGVVVLLAVMASARTRQEIRGLSKRAWGLLAAIALVSGSVPFLLTFAGLRLTNALTGAVLDHLQFVLVGILAFWVLKERLPVLSWCALGLVAALSVLGLGTVEWNLGAIFLLLSTVFYAIGWVLIKTLLKDLSLLTILGARMTLGAILLGLYVVLTGQAGTVAAVFAAGGGALLVTAALLLAFNVTMVTALKYAPATPVIAIGLGAPAVTWALMTAAGSPHVAPLSPSTWLTLATIAVLYAARPQKRRPTATESAL